MNMQYSKSGLALTEGFEGCKLTAYQDVAGIWTCGYGHTGPEVVEGLTVTQAQAEAWLLADVQNAVNHVNSLVTIAVDQNIFDSLVDFAYNVGGEALASSTLLRLLNQGDFKDAALEFDKWDHAGGQVVAGLLRRREAEAKEFLS